MSSSEQHSSKEPKLPPGWSKGFSKSQNKAYYCHNQSKHTQWHFPTASEVANPKKAMERAKQNQKMEASKKHQRKHHHHDSADTLGTIFTEIPQIDSNNPAKKRPRTSSSSSGAETSRNKSSSNDHKSSWLEEEDRTCPAIIVPYRDLHPAQNRAKHLEQFIPHMHKFLDRLIQQKKIRDYHIYIVEQSDDGRKFNRGKLLNIGFDLARKNKVRPTKAAPHDVFIFHDVDLLPHNDLEYAYSQFPTSPLHIARVWDRYSNNPKYFGGIVSFSSSDMKRINGYPNTFWGWGGEDDEMQKRCQRLGMSWTSPSKGGTITDLEQMSLQDKLAFLRQNKEWKCMVKWEALDEHETTWRTNGLADLKYKVLNVKHLPHQTTQGNPKVDSKKVEPSDENKTHACVIHTDVELNGNHWANDKCGTDYMGH